MNETLNQQEQIFWAALEIQDPEERENHLANACGNDQALFEKVKRLLDLHGREDHLLDKTSDGLFAERPSSSPVDIGEQIGLYKLLQQIGLGGMGLVYMAEQSEPIRRKVAIKVLKLGMDSRNVLARFESERQALAMLDHPNITKIHDAGVTEKGRPYFVMELITGLSITQYADQRKLSLRKRMELFHKVCGAVQHAHQKGIIHRDIKPSNIMVTEFDGEAVPKIIDFGIAKAVNEPLTEKTLFTSYGNLIGTPEYMSPEQAEMNGLDVDTCSDVYSLGVVLYELMTGSTPYSKYRDSGLLKICEAICKEEAVLASTRANNLADTENEISTNRGIDERGLNRFLKGDIDWILAKCLAKQRDDRYGSAAELAADIRRHLDGEPILAAGPSKIYRAKRFLEKHRFAVSTAAIVASALLITSIVSFVFAIRAGNAEELAQQRLKESQRAQSDLAIERDRALAAEERIRELERDARFEAALSKALARYRHRIPQWNSQDARNELKQSRVVTKSSGTKSAGAESVGSRSKLPIPDAPPGAVVAGQRPGNQFDINLSDNYTISVGQQKYQLGYGDRTNRQRARRSQRKNFFAMAPENRERAEHFMVIVKSELENRFGERDLVVAEPAMILCQMAMKRQDWDEAEKRIQQLQEILENNEVDPSVVEKQKLLLAMVTARKNQDLGAIEKMIDQHQHIIAVQPQVKAGLSNALDNIKKRVADAKVELEKTGNKLKIDMNDATRMIEIKMINDCEQLHSVDELIVDEVMEGIGEVIKKRPSKRGNQNNTSASSRSR